jgi:F-type H+-transporting ATPase subunit b
MTLALMILAAAETEEYGSDVFPPFDFSTYPSQLFWLAITFGVLYFALSSWVLPRIGSAIEERRDRIADDLDAASQAKADADAAVEAYEQALADARSKAHGIAADTRKALDDELAKESAEVEAELNAKQDAAEAAIKSAKEKAFAEVRGIASTAAAEITLALAKVETSEADAAKAVDAAAEGS